MDLWARMSRWSLRPWIVCFLGASRSPPVARRGTAAADADADGPEPAPHDDLLMATALEHYRRTLKAQREGNWSLYGEEIRQLGEVLERRRENL